VLLVHGVDNTGLLASQEGHVAFLEVLLALPTRSLSNADEGLDLEAPTPTEIGRC
jgi:hypothetical protein